MKSFVRFLALLIALSLAVCLPSHAAKRTYGEFQTPPPSKCSLFLKKLRANKARLKAGVYFGLPYAGLALSFGYLIYFVADNAKNALVENFYSIILQQTQDLEAPIADPLTRIKAAGDVADVIFHNMDRNPFKKDVFDILIRLMRKNVVLWHAGHGEELLATAKGDPREFRWLLTQTFDEKLRTSEPMLVSKAIPLHSNWSWFAYDLQTFPELQADARRLLESPAAAADRPDEYRTLVADVLVLMEADAREHRQRNSVPFIQNIFGPQARARFEKFLEEDSRRFLQPKSPEATASVIAALEAALPGQTVKEALDKAGIPLILFEGNPIRKFLAQEARTPD